MTTKLVVARSPSQQLAHIECVTILRFFSTVHDECRDQHLELIELMDYITSLLIRILDFLLVAFPVIADPSYYSPVSDTNIQLQHVSINDQR